MATNKQIGTYAALAEKADYFENRNAEATDKIAFVDRTGLNKFREEALHQRSHNGHRTGERAHISVEYVFEAAHFLPNHDGKCREVHGHSYRFQIEVSGQIINEAGHPKEGMVVDFGDLKSMVKELIWARLDHKFLNQDLPEVGIPTAENLVIWMKDVMFYHVLPNLSGVEFEAVRLWETASTMVEVRR